MKLIEREKSLKWWYNLTFEERFYKTIAANEVIDGDRTRNPDSLNKDEIYQIYLFHNKNN